MEAKEKIVVDTYERELSTKHYLHEKRESGFVPAIVYGGELKENINIFVKEHEIVKLIRKVGENHPIALKIGGKEIVTIVKDFDYNVLSNRMRHIDFYVVSEKKVIKTHIPLRFLGVSKAEKEGGLVEKFHLNVEVEARMAAIPDFIDIDLSVLDKGSKIHARDLALPKGVTLETPADEVILIVTGKRETIEEPTAAGGMTQEEADKAKEIFD